MLRLQVVSQLTLAQLGEVVVAISQESLGDGLVILQSTACEHVKEDFEGPLRIRLVVRGRAAGTIAAVMSSRRFLNMRSQS